jgi:hypothetical protein
MALSPGIKRLSHEYADSQPFPAVAKNDCRFISTPRICLRRTQEQMYLDFTLFNAAPPFFVDHKLFRGRNGTTDMLHIHDTAKNVNV